MVSTEGMVSIGVGVVSSICGHCHERAPHNALY
jgi:hypothetical protein